MKIDGNKGAKKLIMNFHQKLVKINKIEKLDQGNNGEFKFFLNGTTFELEKIELI